MTQALISKVALCVLAAVASAGNAHAAKACDIGLDGSICGAQAPLRFDELKPRLGTPSGTLAATRGRELVFFGPRVVVLVQAGGVEELDVVVDEPQPEFLAYVAPNAEGVASMSIAGVPLEKIKSRSDANALLGKFAVLSEDEFAQVRRIGKFDVWLHFSPKCGSRSCPEDWTQYPLRGVKVAPALQRQR